MGAPLLELDEQSMRVSSGITARLLINLLIAMWPMLESVPQRAARPGFYTGWFYSYGNSAVRRSKKTYYNDKAKTATYDYALVIHFSKTETPPTKFTILA